MEYSDWLILVIDPHSYHSRVIKHHIFFALGRRRTRRRERNAGAHRIGTLIKGSG